MDIAKKDMIIMCRYNNNQTEQILDYPDLNAQACTCNQNHNHDGGCNCKKQKSKNTMD